MPSDARLWSQLRLRRVGVTDPAVLAAMRTVPREAFVPLELAECAYDDMPLPIGEGQTISQPSIVALMTAALQPSSIDRVLKPVCKGHALAASRLTMPWIMAGLRHGSVVSGKAAQACLSRRERVRPPTVPRWPAAPPAAPLSCRAGQRAPAEVLAAVLAPAPPCAGVFPGWLSILPARGARGRGAAARSAPRRGACLWSQPPAQRPGRTAWETGGWGGHSGADGHRVGRRAGAAPREAMPPR